MGELGLQRLGLTMAARLAFELRNPMPDRCSPTIAPKPRSPFAKGARGMFSRTKKAATAPTVAASFHSPPPAHGRRTQKRSE